jgi:hypothetical protein
MKSSIILTDRNAARVAEYAELVGWAPERLVNRLVSERLDEFDDVGAGSLEGFLGSIDYDTRKSAEYALAQIVQGQGAIQSRRHLRRNGPGRHRLGRSPDVLDKRLAGGCVKGCFSMALYDNCSVLIQLPKDYSKTNELVRFLESKLEGCIFEIRESATEDEPQAAHAFVAENLR